MENYSAKADLYYLLLEMSFALFCPKRICCNVFNFILVIDDSQDVKYIQ